MFVEKLVVPPIVFGGEGSEGTDAAGVVDDIFSREAEVQSAGDADWDSNSGDHSQKESSESETGDGEESEQEAAADEETDSSEEGEESESESEDDKVVLPKQQAKSYDDKLMAHFAKRLGATLADLKGNLPLTKAVKSLIDNAIYAEQQNAKLAELTAEDETGTTEEEESQTEEAKTEKSQTPEEQFAEYDKQLESLVDRVNDPKMVDAYVTAMAKTWGIDPSKPEQMAALKAKGIDLHAQARLQTKFAINLFNTVAPMFQSQWLEAAMPGMGKMYEGALHETIWHEVAGAKEFANAELPEYGSPEFRQKFQETLKAYPWIDKMKFDGPRQAQLAQKYRVAAQMMLGRKPDQATVEKALETGRREERKAQTKKSGATKMGAGKTDGKFGAAKPQQKGSGLGIVEEYEARKGMGF